VSEIEGWKGKRARQGTTDQLRIADFQSLIHADLINL